ncbi:MAG: ATP-binding protein [Massilia sp.]
MITSSDYQAIFRHSPYPYLVFTPELTIVAASDAYLRMVARSLDDIVGRHAFEAFPINPDDPDTTNQDEIRRSVQRAVTSCKPDSTAFLRYAVPIRGAQGVQFEERFWSTVHTPVRDNAGAVTLIIQNAIDVTEMYRLNRETKRPVLDLNQQAENQARGFDEDFNRAQMNEAVSRILNDERGHLRNLFNQAPGFVAVLTGPNFVVEMVNEAYYQLVGHRQIVGKPVFEALPDIAGQGFEELLGRVYTTGEPWSGRGIPVSIQRLRGGPTEKRNIDLVYQPYRAKDGQIVGIFAQGYDVTEAFEAQDAQRESEERLHQGMQAARMVVWDWQLDSRRIVFSDNVVEVLGRSADTIDELYESIDPDDQVMMRHAHQHAIDTRSGYQAVLRFTRPDNGKQISLDVRGTVQCDAGGTPRTMRGVTLDITERVKAEADLREADRRKDEFLAMLAHELRNPLAPISTAAQLLSMGGANPALLKQAGDIITRQVTHMTGLVDDLLDVSRVTRGLVELNNEHLDLKAIVNHAVEQARPLIESRGHALTTYMGSAHPVVNGDRLRLVQVISNLLNNAAKYTAQGGAISLSVETHDEQVEISIGDNGLGIDPALLPRIFDLFTQGERTPDRSQGGLGLGLALVKSIMELHGGSVGAYSAGIGHGSIFKVVLPLAQAGAQAAPADRASEAGEAGGLTLMVVDDNVDAADTLAELLRVLGHAVFVAHNGQSALKEALLRRYDAFVLDIGLPDMDGYALARRLQAHADTRAAVLIALTGYGQAHDRVLSKAAGFSHHFVKPVDLGCLHGALEQIAAARR